LEILVGGYFLAGVLTLYQDISWTTDGAGFVKMSFGYYLTILGYIIYLAAWPVEFVIGRRAISREAP